MGVNWVLTAIRLETLSRYIHLSHYLLYMQFQYVLVSWTIPLLILYNYEQSIPVRFGDVSQPFGIVLN